MTPIGARDRPRLPAYVRLRHDPVRDRWVLLAPERVLFPCPITLAIFERLDGDKTFATLVDELAEAYEAPRDVIEGDVVELLGDLRAKGFLDLAGDA